MVKRKQIIKLICLLSATVDYPSLKCVCHSFDWVKNKSQNQQRLAEEGKLQVQQSI